MILCDQMCIDVIYSGIGLNLDLINKYANKNQIMLNFIYRKEDLNIGIMQIQDFTNLRLHLIELI